MKNEKVCCFISGTFMPFLNGERFEPEENRVDVKIKKEIDDLIEKQNVTVFYTGMEEGADLFAADYILSLKEKNNLSLHCVIPYEEQAANYSEESRNLYYSVAQRCDSETMLNKKRTFSCRLDRDIYMIEKSDIVFLYWDMKAPYTSSLIPYFQKKELVVVDPLFSKLDLLLDYLL